jgi:2',3'-cyclic-nucleotide 2'-phosphodiesterase (5'-nucleotidase family)
VGGHNHGALGPIWVGQTLIAKTGNAGRFVGRVDLQFEAKKLTNIKGQLIPVMNVAAAPDIATIIGLYASKVAQKMNEVIGEATADLPLSNNSESPLGNLIADVYRERGKTQIGLQNTGGIRTRIVKGPITWGAVFEVLPFQNTMVTLKLTGAQLKKTLNVGILAVSGLRVQLDLKKPAGQQLVSVMLPDGTPINDTALYSITTNDFIIAGGDGFSEVGKGTEIKDSGILLRDVLVDYIKARKTLSPALDGRVTVN